MQIYTIRRNKKSQRQLFHNEFVLPFMPKVINRSFSLKMNETRNEWNETMITIVHIFASVAVIEIAKNQKDIAERWQYYKTQLRVLNWGLRVHINIILIFIFSFSVFALCISYSIWIDSWHCLSINEIRMCVLCESSQATQSNTSVKLYIVHCVLCIELNMKQCSIEFL